MADDKYSGCKELAQTEGALAQVDGICVVVYGKVIPITSDGVDIQEAAEITNFNFHCNGTKPALPSPEFAPGTVEGYKTA